MQPKACVGITKKKLILGQNASTRCICYSGDFKKNKKNIEKLSHGQVLQLSVPLNTVSTIRQLPLKFHSTKRLAKS